MQSTLKNRTIFCRDNLDVLRGINTESIDLIYLDPPFNKNKRFTAPTGSKAEGASFDDIFTRDSIKDEWIEELREDNKPLADYIDATGKLGKMYNRYYLVYMARRLMEMHRILKKTGSIYFHCDPTMSHYIKVLMDGLFGEDNFRNEIVWHYGGGSDRQKGFNRKHDILFLYSKSDNWYFHTIYDPFKESTRRRFDKEDAKGRYKVNKMKDGRVYKTYMKPEGKQANDVWYINIIVPSHREHVGYPTQKPLALLERILQASSKEGNLVLDPFCGSATTCIAAECLGRKWIGIDHSPKALEVAKYRLARDLNCKNKIIYKQDLAQPTH